MFRSRKVDHYEIGKNRYVLVSLNPHYVLVPTLKEPETQLKEQQERVRESLSEACRKRLFRLKLHLPGLLWKHLRKSSASTYTMKACN
jgi:hypothetical protein